MGQPRPATGTVIATEGKDLLALKMYILKGLSHEMDLAFDDMYD